MKIDTRLLETAGSIPTQPSWVLQEIVSKPDHPLFSQLDSALNSISVAEVEDYFSDPNRQWRRPNNDRIARLDVLIADVERQLYEQRREALCVTDQTFRAAPYNHPVLQEIELDKDNLVRADSLRWSHTGWISGSFAFHLPPSLDQANSSYWAFQKLRRLDSSADLSIRLDPLLVCSLKDYQAAGYRMFVYGRPLDWDRLAKLKEEEHAQWMPDSVRSAGGIHSTQLSWTPKDDGLHFKCEELPLIATSRPARYVHAIYDPKSKSFSHFDAAVRYYTGQELTERSLSHVRRAGKFGRRVKLFRTDGFVDRDLWCDIVAAFFVWNDDMRDYFLGAKPLVSGI